MQEPTITWVDGILVGNAEDREKRSGCTVVLFEDGDAPVAYVARGGWPGTFDTDSVRPGKTFYRKHAILLTGGDIYGFGAVQGVIRYLRERGIVRELSEQEYPKVVGANIFDVGYADVEGVDYSKLGYLACVNSSRRLERQGNVGAGIGATVGKFAGMERAMKGGLGSHAITHSSGIVVGALVIVNAIGNVYDLETSRYVAGARGVDGQILEHSKYEGLFDGRDYEQKGTTIGVVATNVKLSHEELLKVAEMADDGLARAIRPVHMTSDGDTIFAVSTERFEMGSSVSRRRLLDYIGDVASECVRRSVVKAVINATSEGLP